MMRKTVLIVDDDLIGAEAVRLRLLQVGYAVHVAGSGYLAMGWLASNKADLVILDAVMPFMSGFDVCRWMRSNADTRFIPVIFLTARNTVQERAEAHAAGSDVYVTKSSPATRLVNLADMFLSEGALAKRGATAAALTH